MHAGVAKDPTYSHWKTMNNMNTLPDFRRISLLLGVTLSMCLPNFEP